MNGVRILEENEKSPTSNTDNKSNVIITVTSSPPNNVAKTAVRPTHLSLPEPLGQQFFSDSDTILHIDDISPGLTLFRIVFFFF